MNTSEESIKTGSRAVGESNKFASDIVWFSAAQIFVSLIFGMIALPALTKSYASETYGIWVQITVTVDLISPLVSLQLGLAAVRFLAGEEDKAKRRRAMGTMLLAIIVFAGVVSAGGALFSRQLSEFLFDSPEYVNYVGLLIVWTFFNSIFNFLLGYLRARGRIRQISAIQVAITLMKMLAMVGLARSASSFVLIVIAMVSLQVVFPVYILMMITKELGFPIPNLSGLRTFLAYSMPQMPVIVSLWIKSLSDRYFVTQLLGLTQNSIYSSSATVAALTSLFYAPISYVLFAVVSKLWKQQRSLDVKRYIEYSMKFFLTLAIPGAIGITVVSQPLLRLLTTSEFLAGQQIVLLLVLGGIFLGIFQINTNVILLDKYSKFLPVMAGSGAVTSILMNLILVPRVGMTGAAVSNCVSYFVVAVITTLWARKTISYGFDFKYIGKVTASALVMLLALLLLRVNSTWGIMLAVVVGSVVFAAGLIISRAWSKQDMKLIKGMLTSLVSKRARAEVKYVRQLPLTQIHSNRHISRE